MQEGSTNYNSNNNQFHTSLAVLYTETNVFESKKNLVRHVAREVAIRSILEMTHITSLMICNVHLAVIVNPESANDNVVNSRRYFTPRIVTRTPRKQKMSNAWQMHHSNFNSIITTKTDINKARLICNILCNYHHESSDSCHTNI